MSFNQKQAMAEHVRRILGAKNVSKDYFQVSNYCADNVSQNAFGFSGKKPFIVARPRSAEQIRAIILAANEWKIPVIPRAGGTNYSRCATPNHDGEGIVVELSAINKVLQLDRPNFSVTVEPGITVKDFNRFLRRKGLWWPHDPGSRDWATVGGVISTQSIGTFSTKYGTAQDTVTAMKVITSSGEMITIGSKVSKSVTGYNLLRLFMGAEGTLGLIIEVTLKVFPRPKRRRVKVFGFKKFTNASRAACKIIDSGLVPESLNLECKDRFSHMASRQKNREKVAREIKGNEAFIILSMAGDKQVVSTTTPIAAKYCKYAGGRELTSEIVNSYWKAKTKLVTELQTGRKYHSADVAVPRGKVQQLYDRYVQTGKKYGLEIYGIRYYIQHPHIDPPTSPTILLDDNNKSERKQYENWNVEFSKIGPDLGGTMSSILGVGTRLNKIVEYELGAGLGLMKTIKKAFDPQNLFNPGKKFET